MHLLNEYVDISDTDFPVQNFRRGAESMSRKIFKKVVFLLMFCGAILGMYTFFSGMNESDKRSGAWKGLVNNMYIGADGQQGPGHPHDHDHDHAHNSASDKLKNMPSFGDILASQDKEQVKDEEGFEYNRKPADFGRFAVPQDVHKNEWNEKPEIMPEVKAKEGDIDVKDRHGNVIGQKLFAFGMSRDDLAKHADRVQPKDNANEEKYDNNEEINVIENHGNDEQNYNNEQNENGEQNYDNEQNDNGEQNPNGEQNDAPEDLMAEAPTEDTLPQDTVHEEDVGEEVKDDFHDIREEDINGLRKVVVTDNRGGYGGDENANNVVDDGNGRSNVNVLDENGNIVGQKLFPFGIRPGTNRDQEESLSSRKLQQEEPHHVPITARQVKDIRPDAAFFDDHGNKKDGDDAEMDRMSEFQQRMGLRNPLLKHKFDVNDPFHHHRALFRPLGANGMNPALGNDPEDSDDDGKDPKDAFAGVDRDSIWGNRDDRLFRPHPQAEQHGQKGIAHKNVVGHDIHLGGHAVEAQQQPRGQLMGYHNEGSNQNNGIPNRNLPIVNGAPEHRLMGYPDGSNNKIIPSQHFGGNMGRQFPQREVPNGQMMGQNFGQNQFGGQLMGLNNNNRFPINNGYNNQNKAFGNVNGNNVPNQFANNNFGQQQLMGANGLNRNMGQPVSNQMFPNQHGGQLMGLNGGAGVGAGQQWGPIRNLNPNQPPIGAVTAVGKFEDQIVNPINTNVVFPKINENVQIQNTDEEEEALFIEDLTKELGMDADCIPFPFPSGEASLCVPKMVVEDEQEMARKLEELGTWEPGSLKQLSEILVSDPTIGVVDIGAGIGVYTLAAALMGRHVVAVEPLFINYRMLHKSALTNNVAGKIVLVSQALDKESYMGHMVYSRDAGEFNKVHIERLAQGDTSRDPANNVHVTTLNQLVKAIPFRKALLKIDVGGTMEADILDAGTKFFSSIDIPYILTHWNGDIDFNKKIHITSKLATLGYKPARTWNGVGLDPNSLQNELNFLVWRKE